MGSTLRRRSFNSHEYIAVLFFISQCNACRLVGIACKAQIGIRRLGARQSDLSRGLQKCNDFTKIGLANPGWSLRRACKVIGEFTACIFAQANCDLPCMFSATDGACRETPD